MNFVATGTASRTERKRRDIFDAARVVFTREGYAPARMEQIARDAGVSTATLYAHYPSKAELFRTVVDDSLADVVTQVRTAGQVDGDARRRLTAFGVAYAAFYSDPTSRALFRLIVAERRRFPELSDHFGARGRTELGGVLLKMVRSLSDAGELKVEKASWAAGQLQGMIEHATLLVGLVGGDEVHSRRSIKAIVDDAVSTFLARYGVRERGTASGK